MRNLIKKLLTESIVVNMSNPVPEVGDYFYANGELYPIVEVRNVIISMDEDYFDGYHKYLGKKLPEIKTGVSLNGDRRNDGSWWTLGKYHHWFQLVRKGEILDTDKLFDNLYESIEDTVKKGDKLMASKTIPGSCTAGKVYTVFGLSSNFYRGEKEVFFVNDAGRIITFNLSDVKNHFTPFNYDTTTDMFNQLTESEEDDLEWARDVIATPINDIRVGDVFYITDTDSNRPKPDDYKPVHARYVFVVSGIESGREIDQGYGIMDNMFLTYKLCDPDDVTYNSNDYRETSGKCQGFTSDDGEEYASTGINWAKRLLDIKYWRRMR